MYRISELARQFHLSRSTLLYYDRIGLLKAAGRTRAGYRIYTEADRRRLETICTYRTAGLALEEIFGLLESDGAPELEILKKRMSRLNREIHERQGQQRILAGMIRSMAAGEAPTVVEKKLWVEMLRAAGMNERAMEKWHKAFEKRAPEAHREFLLSLGISEKETARIRERSRAGKRRRRE